MRFRLPCQKIPRKNMLILRHECLNHILQTLPSLKINCFKVQGLLDTLVLQNVKTHYSYGVLGEDNKTSFPRVHSNFYLSKQLRRQHTAQNYQGPSSSFKISIVTLFHLILSLFSGCHLLHNQNLLRIVAVAFFLKWIVTKHNLGIRSNNEIHDIQRWWIEPTTFIQSMTLIIPV